MLIAITGGIGAGKSTILDQFKKLGAFTLDADNVAHQLYLPGQPAYNELLLHWGNDILLQDGTINRKAIAEKVFNNKTELDWLNQLIHPLVKNKINQEAKNSEKPLFCAIPLLYESGWDDQADKVVAVWCDKHTQLKRLLDRGWSEEHAKQRLATQWHPDEKLHRADYAVITNCSWDLLAMQCQLIYGSVISTIR